MITEKLFLLNIHEHFLKNKHTRFIYIKYKIIGNITIN
jgi:hypothetical protein